MKQKQLVKDAAEFLVFHQIPSFVSTYYVRVAPRYFIAANFSFIFFYQLLILYNTWIS